MGAPESNTTNIYGIHLRESANDGSDFSNAASDYRVLFLGEDGSLHVKDSAGTVTDPFTTSGIPATIFDAKGDIIVASAADTAARLAAGTDYQHLVARAAATNGVEWQGSAWTDYTPSWTASTTNPTLGSTTVVGRYKLLDTHTGIVQISVSITTGGAWNAGSGQYAFSLPAGMTAATGRYQVGPAHILDSGTTHFAAIAKVASGGTTINEILVADGSAPRTFSHNAPIATFATGDQMNLEMILEIQ